MSTTDLQYAEVHAKGYRNHSLVLLIHIFGSEQRSKAFIFALARFVVLFHICTVLQGRLLSRSNNIGCPDSSLAIVSSQ